MTGILNGARPLIACLTFFGFLLLIPIGGLAGPLPDTGQTKCYNNSAEIPCPSPGEAFYGQDGNYTINPPSYTKLDASGNTHLYHVRAAVSLPAMTARRRVI